jgi:hypothetical protein
MVEDHVLMEQDQLIESVQVTFGSCQNQGFFIKQGGSVLLTHIKLLMLHVMRLLVNMFIKLIRPNLSLFTHTLV